MHTESSWKMEVSFGIKSKHGLFLISRIVFCLFVRDARLNCNGTPAFVTVSPINIFTCMSVTIKGVWIGNQIYWTLQHTTHDYTSQITVTQTSVLSLLQSPLATFNGGRSPSSGFPNCPRPQLPDPITNSSQGLNFSNFLTHWLTNSVIRQPTNSTD
jgi:hypothetical protein